MVDLPILLSPTLLLLCLLRRHLMIENGAHFLFLPLIRFVRAEGAVLEVTYRTAAPTRTEQAGEGEGR